MLMHIKIEDVDGDHINVNGVSLEKRHVAAMFPATPDQEKALAKYLAIVPFLVEMGEHFRTTHKLSECTAYAVDMAPALYKALGITEETTIPFMMVCFEICGDTPETMAQQCRDAFGACGKQELKREGNVIQFPTRNGHTVH